MPNRCPNPQLLARLLVGDLSDEQYSAIESHVEQCDECQNRLDSLEESHVRFLPPLRLNEAELERDDRECDQVVSNLQRIGPVVEQLQGESFGRAENTAPPQRTGEGSTPVAPELPPRPKEESIPLSQIGPYEILETLGQGGMGTVYRARHTRLKRTAAIKILAAHRLRDPKALARFHREMEVVGKFDHPNIVRAHDANEQDGTHYLVMEYIDGVDLSRLVERHGPLNPADACALIVQAAAGLRHAHEQGVVHRDIKPSNLMLAMVERPGEASGSGQRSHSSETVCQPTVKVLDLGLALLHESAPSDEMTSDDQLLGTLDYMAPEQAVDTHRVDVRADIYSLGATLYKLLSGQSPLGHIRAGDRLKKFVALTTERPMSVGELRPELPSALVALVDRMVCRDRERRYASLLDVMEALQPWTAQADLAKLFARAHDGPPPAAGMALNGPSVSARSRGRKTTGWRRDFGRHSMIAVSLVIASLLVAFIPRLFMLKNADDRRTSPGHSLARTEAQPASPPDLPLEGWHGWPADAPVPAIAPFHADQAHRHQREWASYLGVPVEWTNSAGIAFRLIPPGEFVMGAPQAEIDETLANITADNQLWIDNVRSEGPRHRVVLTQPLFVSLHEVTQRSYYQLMAANPSHFSEDLVGQDGGNHPVEQVTWGDALRFCQVLSDREGREAEIAPNLDAVPSSQLLRRRAYRLLTEAEWEFACRSGTLTRYSSGDREEELALVAWYGPTSSQRTHPVGELQPNAFGLFDMHGNVWEWCYDTWVPESYSPFQNKAAVDPLVDLPKSEYRVHRGGDWNYVAQVCRSAHRHTTRPESFNAYLGFRIAIPAAAIAAEQHSSVDQPRP